MISRETVQKIAGLARLELTENETEKMQKDLTEILGYIDKLKEVNISAIQPTSHSVPLFDVTRPDAVHFQEPDTIKQMLDQSPQAENNYIKVKAILNN